MASPAWLALEDQNSLADVTAVLLSSAPPSPATAAAVMARVVLQRDTRKGAALLIHYADGIPLRRVSFTVLATLPDDVVGPVSVSAVALIWRGTLVALRDFTAVQLTRENPQFVVPIDWTVSAEGGTDQ